MIVVVTTVISWLVPWVSLDILKAYPVEVELAIGPIIWSLAGFNYGLNIIIYVVTNPEIRAAVLGLIPGHPGANAVQPF